MAGSLSQIQIKEFGDLVEVRCVQCDRILIHAPLCEVGAARAAVIVWIWSAITYHARREHPLIH